MKIIGRSKALHSTWFFLPTYKILLDCGESASLELGTQTTDIHYIFLSHLHVDHWSGLLSVARYQKRISFKDKTRHMATVLYHPDEQDKVDAIRSFLESKEMRLFLKFETFAPGEQKHLRDNFYMEAFEVDHNAPYYKKKLPAMGMHLIEKRKKLRPEMAAKKTEIDEKYKDEPSKAHEEFTKFIVPLKKEKGEDALMEQYDHKMLSYCGDSKPVDPKLIAGTEILMHEATFFQDDDIEAAHTSVEEAIATAKAAQPGRFVMYHLSERYFRERIDYIKQAHDIAEKEGLDMPFYVVPVSKLFVKDV